MWLCAQVTEISICCCTVYTFLRVIYVLVHCKCQHCRTLHIARTAHPAWSIRAGYLTHQSLSLHQSWPAKTKSKTLKHTSPCRQCQIFFANPPATWFQRAEARFAVARPTTTSQLQQTSFHNAPSPRPETMATGTLKWNRLHGRQVHGRRCQLHLGPATDSTTRCRRGCAHQRPVWSPYNGGRYSRRDHCRQSPSTPAEYRPHTTNLRIMKTEFVGTTTNSSINLTYVFLPAAGRETVWPPYKENAASGVDCRIKRAIAMSFSHGSGLLYFKDQHSKIIIPRRFRSYAEHLALLFFGGATWGKRRQHPHLWISKKYLGVGLWRQIFYTWFSPRQSGNPHSKIRKTVEIPSFNKIRK